MGRSLEELEGTLAQMKAPSIAKVRRDSKSDCQIRAAMALREALAYLGWSQRHAAEALGVDQKVIVMWIKGVQQPAWLPLALPRDGYVTYLQTLARYAPAQRTGTDG